MLRTIQIENGRLDSSLLLRPTQPIATLAPTSTVNCVQCAALVLLEQTCTQHSVAHMGLGGISHHTVPTV